MPEMLVQEWFIFYLFIFCGQHQETGNIILFPSFSFPKSIPAVGGPRLYGARQVGSGLYHTKVMMTCVAVHCDLRNCLKVPFPLLGSKPAAGPMSEAQQGVNIYGCQNTDRGLA